MNITHCSTEEAEKKGLCFDSKGCSGMLSEAEPNLEKKKKGLRLFDSNDEGARSLQAATAQASSYA